MKLKTKQRVKIIVADSESYADGAYGEYGTITDVRYNDYQVLLDNGDSWIMKEAWVEILPNDPAPSAAGGPPGATTMNGFGPPTEPTSMSIMRTFETGATRSNDAGKIDPEGFLSPLVIERYCQYLNKHRVQADGKLRDSDNWQRGMGKSTYMKSAWRHFLDMWKGHRYDLTGIVPAPEQIEANEDTIMAVLFNVMGYAHETIKNRITPTSETK